MSSEYYNDLKAQGWLSAQFLLGDESIVYGLINPQSALDLILNFGMQLSVQMWVPEEDKQSVEEQAVRNVLVSLM